MINETPSGTSSGRTSQVSGAQSMKRIGLWFHSTAWAVAENVNDGTATGPSAARAWTVSISPMVHDDTATQLRTPK